MNIKFYLKIVGSLLISYVVVVAMSPIIFEKNSFPKPRKNVDKYLAKTASDYGKSLLSIVRLSPKDKQAVIELAQDNVLVNIAPNVKAVNRGSTIETIYDMDNMQFTKYTYTKKNGDVVILKIPVGVSPPPQGRF